MTTRESTETRVLTETDNPQVLLRGGHAAEALLARGGACSARRRRWLGRRSRSHGTSSFLLSGLKLSDAKIHEP